MALFMKKENTMKKTVLCIINALMLSAGIVGCSKTSSVTESTPKEVRDESATKTPTKTTRKIDSSYCSVKDVADGIVTLEEYKSDIIYQTPVSNLIVGNEIDPDQKYIIDYRIEDKIKIGENIYYIEKCELVSADNMTKPIPRNTDPE